MIIVEFLRNTPPYAKGELAGFDRDRAEELRKTGCVKFKRTDDDDAPVLITAPMDDVDLNEHADPVVTEPAAPEGPGAENQAPDTGKADAQPTAPRRGRPPRTAKRKDAQA